MKYQMTVTVNERDDFNGHYSRRGKSVKVVRADTIKECWSQIYKSLRDGDWPEETDPKLVGDR